MANDDPVLGAVRAAQELGYAGVILCGPPGTGKSWYAQQVAVALSGSWEAVRSVQFHPSYQYEDFVTGYAPGEGGGFELRPRILVNICQDAGKDPDTTYVLVIDEISRSDVVRVFGEALTYIETDKRGIPFRLAVGEELTVPKNLFVVGTMNPWDTGVDELDFALERRFAQVELKPDVEVLRRLVAEGGAEAGHLERLASFFGFLQGLHEERVKIGHAYFLRCLDTRLADYEWQLRLGPTLRRGCGGDHELFQEIEERWLRDVVQGLG